MNYFQFCRVQRIRQLKQNIKQSYISLSKEKDSVRKSIQYQLIQHQKHDLICYKMMCDGQLRELSLDF